MSEPDVRPSCDHCHHPRFAHHHPNVPPLPGNSACGWLDARTYTRCACPKYQHAPFTAPSGARHDESIDRDLGLP